ncbi:MAG: hypothetical protein HRU26_02600 [Psychroserpens sp.]|nr:hypothetical protein [Psychroserpens sp.]
MKQVIIILVFFVSGITCSQDFQKVDSIVSKYPDRFISISDFASAIDKDFDTDIEMVRATYYWISTHIFYDFDGFRNRTEVYKPISHESEEEYQRKLLEMQRKYAESVLEKKSAICEGYTQLLKFTLNEMGIECEVIEGYTNTETKQIGRRRSITDHAWNAIKINDKWFLIDATWSTGNHITHPELFDFSDTYFLIDPEEMILNHYPKEAKWQLLDQPISKNIFLNFPVIKEPYFNSGLKIQEGTQGIIRTKSGKNITLNFEEIDATKTYYYSFENLGHSYPLEFIETESGYETQVLFESTRNSDLYIVVDDYIAIEYKVRLQR